MIQDFTVRCQRHTIQFLGYGYSKYIENTLKLLGLTIDYANGAGQALVNANDLKGIVNALRRAKRARVSFEPSGTSLDGMSLIIDTELIRYKWQGVNDDYPDYGKLIPTEFNTFASFDT